MGLFDWIRFRDVDPREGLRLVRTTDQLSAGVATAFVIDCDTGLLYWSACSSLIVSPRHASVLSFQRAIGTKDELFCTICYGAQATLSKDKIIEIVKTLSHVIVGDVFAGIGAFAPMSTAAYHYSGGLIALDIQTRDYGWGVCRPSGPVSGMSDDVEETPILIRRTRNDLLVRSPATGEWVIAQFRLDEAVRLTVPFSPSDLRDKWIIGRAIDHGKIAMSNERGQAVFCRIEDRGNDRYSAVVEPAIVSFPGIYVGKRVDESGKHAFIKATPLQSGAVQGQILTTTLDGFKLLTSAANSRSSGIMLSGSV